MPRRIVPVFAVLLTVLIAGSLLTSGRPDPAAAQQASPAASTPCPATTTEENKEVVRHFYEDAYGQGASRSWTRFSPMTMSSTSRV